MYDEIDILKLIRVIRYAKFISSGVLKAHHWHLIGNFDKYCIKDDDSDSCSCSSCDELDCAVDHDDDHYPGHAHDDEASHENLSYYTKPEH